MDNTIDLPIIEGSNMDIEFYRLICPDNYINLKKYVLILSKKLSFSDKYINISKMSLIHVIRFFELYKVTLDELKFLNIEVIMTVSTIISYKFLSDDNYKFDDIHKLVSKLFVRCGFSIVSLNYLKSAEMDLLDSLNWNCYISMSDIDEMDDLITKCCFRLNYNKCITL